MKPEFFNHIKRWLSGCLFIFLAGCASNNTEPVLFSQTAVYRQQIDSVKQLARNGDLVFRNGIDDVSRAARSMNRFDTSYSHCGILFRENDSLFVYHAIGGHYNPSQKLRRDPIDSFVFPPESDRLAIYRYELDIDQTDSLRKVVTAHYSNGLKFDLYFDFLSDEKMYCSEFVFKCLNQSLSGSLSSIIQAREWPFGVSPDDLFLSKKSRLVKRVDFLP
jgi:hypothetical protein